MNRIAHRAVCSVTLVVSGCAIVGEDYVPPEIETAAEFTGSFESVYGSSPPTNLGLWWEQLEDPVLNDLVERALERSLELEAAVVAVRRDAALLGQAIGNRYPDIDGFGSGLRSRVGEDSFPANPDAQTFNLWSLGLEFGYELDVWGRVTRLIEASSADLDGSVEDLRDVRALLVASVVSAYVDLREGEARLEVAEQNIETQKASLAITETRFEAGAAPRLDVAQARTNLANTEATLPSVRTSVRLSKLRLGVLLGADPSRFVERFQSESPTASGIPRPPERIQVGVPADLLRQRPDVRAAERALASEVARVGVEIGDLYPRFSFGGTISFEATDTDQWFRESNGIFGLGPSLTWNLFDGGRERGEVRAQEAAAELALVTYRQTVLLALEDAEGAMFSLARDRDEVKALAAVVDAARDSAELSRQLYLAGKSDFQNVLDSERTLFDAQDALIESTAGATQSYVSLLRAIGGGWQEPREPESSTAGDEE